MPKGKIKDRVCAQCEATYTPSYSRQKYCGTVCGHTARYGSPPGAPLTGRVCEVCGATFKATYTEQRACGRDCGWQLRVREGKVRLNAEGGHGTLSPKPRVYKSTKTVMARTCIHCGADFQTTTRAKRYCTDACYRNKYFGVALVRTEVECGKCGKSFLPKSVKGRFCSKPCSKRYWSNLDPNKNVRQRARHHGVAYESGIKPIEIYERDGWRCGICNKKIPKGKKYRFPHPESPSLDHKIPMCLGGGHVRENVQASHLLCNSLKAGSISSEGEQLLLFG